MNISGNDAGSGSNIDALAGRWSQLIGLAVTVLLAMSLWFSATAVSKQLTEAWRLTAGQGAYLTISVQLGFVAGTILSALANLADRTPVHRLISMCAFTGAIANALISFTISDSLASRPDGFFLVLVLRFITGAALAGVYPPGMKLMASWFRSGRGLAIGVMIGALTLGSASPHLLASPLQSWSASELGYAPWRIVLGLSSLAALLSAAFALLWLRPGPLLGKTAPFDWAYGLRMWKDPAIRRANFGYLGHMWELYAMWAWGPMFIAASYQLAGWSDNAARLVGFAIVAIGGLGCVIAGAVADRFGRTTVTIASLIVSGSCAAGVGFLLQQPLLASIVCLIWGFAVVADSAQFSASVTELADPRYVGTALTIQTCAGFLLTNVTIRLTPLLQEQFGWGWAFAALTIGPIFGAIAMWRLRTMPEAEQLAGGNR